MEEVSNSVTENVTIQLCRPQWKEKQVYVNKYFNVCENLIR